MSSAYSVSGIAIVPAAVVKTRKEEKNNAAQDSAAGYTTVINGVTTFVQTRTASIVTRSSYSTLPNGRISTVLQEVTLPIVTVSATAAGAVQTGFETVTIDGQAVVVATQTQYVAGGQVVVTRTLLNGPQAVETVYSTVYQDLTVTRLGVAVHGLCFLFARTFEQLLDHSACTVYIERTLDTEPPRDLERADVGQPIEQFLYDNTSSHVFVFFLEFAYHHEPAYDEPAADFDLASEQFDYQSNQRQPDPVDSHNFSGSDNKRCHHLGSFDQHLAHNIGGDPNLDANLHPRPSSPSRWLPQAHYDLISGSHNPLNFVSYNTCAVEHHDFEKHAGRLHSGIATASGWLRAEHNNHDDASRTDLSSWSSSAPRRLRGNNDAGAFTDFDKRCRAVLNLYQHDGQRLGLPRPRLRVEHEDYACAVDPPEQLVHRLGDDHRPRRVLLDLVSQLDPARDELDSGRGLDYDATATNVSFLVVFLFRRASSYNNSPCASFIHARHLLELLHDNFVQPRA
ncbi:hypothetical protein Rt10032_c11g4529 [Rhodotorula toruloides]|uniref:Uncharacterized protein n=1 Tax=Rhodotorula toruloides TaxID=5286 RepID=A0A511KJF7_RHOTO|nr:hypothetical protein Rt10032_c11g4529 [Rhodotorula toruloides]